MLLHLSLPLQFCSSQVLLSTALMLDISKSLESQEQNYQKPSTPPPPRRPHFTLFPVQIYGEAPEMAKDLPKVTALAKKSWSPGSHSRT